MNWYALTLILGLSLGAYGGHVNGYQLGLYDGVQKMKSTEVNEGWGCYYLRFKDNEPYWEFEFGKYVNGTCEHDNH